jgi:hypothetical protein
MRERAPQILKIICLCLAAWLAWELVKIGRDVNPLGQASIPDVPTLPADTNAPPAVANRPSPLPGTNVMAAAIGAHSPVVAGDTNATPRKRVRASGTNGLANAADSGPATSGSATNLAASTNVATSPATNTSVTVIADTNASTVAMPKAARSNEAPTVAFSVSQTNLSGSNVSGALPANAHVSVSNLTIANLPGDTNLVSGSVRTNLTNSSIARTSGARPPNAAAAAISGSPGGRKPAAALAPEIQARVDRVYESEIFAPIAHPVPMALLGIAGKVAFLRGPNGQTGMVKEGEDLGEVKLLQIGMNRVLVEQDGKKQELMIFAGLGGQSLLTKTNDASNETTKN